MEFYRFFVLDADNRPVERKEHLCNDDLDALEMARKLATAAPVEIWMGTRRVAHINPGDADRDA